MDGKVVIGTELDTKGFDKEIAVLEDKLNDIQATLQMADEDKTLFSTSEIKEMEAEAQKLGRRIDTLREKQAKLDGVGFANMKQSIENVGKSVQKVVKKVGKWALAVFSVRSAYMFVRNAINTIAGNDEQLKADIDYMKSALAYAIEPVVRKIVELAQKLLSYIGYIIYRWTGKNIFENANKSLQGANKEATKLRKTLASFDELNVLNEQDSKSNSGVGPSFDLSNLDQIQKPKWVEWIAENKKLVEGLGATLLAVFGIANISKILANIGLLFGTKAGTGLIALSTLLLGIADVVLIYFVAKGLKETIDEIKLYNDELNRNNQLLDKEKEQHDKMTQAIIERTKAGEISDEQVETSIKGLENSIETSKELIKSMESQKNWINWLTGDNEKLRQKQLELSDATLNDIAAYEELVKANKLTDEQQKKFIETLGEVIEELNNAGIDATDLKDKYTALSGKYTVTVESDVSKAESGLSKLKNAFLSIFSGGGGGKGFATGGIVYHSIPKLASGGIINMPGRGVPLASAIGGERGAEGVIPLTDSQQMALLGETIGKYITINANITTTMNGRVISRELQKVHDDSDFAFNR